MTDIVVGVDESAGAAAALRWALGEARAHGWTVTAVLAWGLLDQHRVPPDDRFDPNYGEADALAALDAAIERAVGPEAAGAIERRAVCDLPARALIDASAGARLLVVGARGLGGFSRLLLGSVSEQCLHHAACAVAIVHVSGGPAGEAGAPAAGAAADERAATEPPADRAAAPPNPRVVVGVDGSAEADLALRWAIEEGRARGATVEAVHAWQPPFVGGYPFAPLPIETDEFEEASRRVLDHAVDTADIGGLPQPVVRTLVCAGAASAVLEAAHGADLVVVGSRGVGGFRGILLGSVSQHVARHAPCPVIIVRPSDRS